MSVWIFQGKPERYDLKVKLKPGTTETWLASRFRERMANGDVVLFWRAGPRAGRGFYGWGQIKSEEPQFYDEWGWGVDVAYNVRFQPPITVDEVEQSGALDDNLLFRMPLGTNFEVTSSEASALAALFKAKNQNSPFKTAN